MNHKNSHKNNTAKKIKFFPVAVLKNGILQIDGHMIYTDGSGRWLYVSEDGQNVLMYNDVADMIRELFKRNDNDDFVVIGWEFEPYRFTDVFNDAYHYYNERFD
jgi:hypothetical protein